MNVTKVVNICLAVVLFTLLAWTFVVVWRLEVFPRPVVLAVVAALAVVIGFVVRRNHLRAAPRRP